MSDEREERKARTIEWWGKTQLMREDPTGSMRNVNINIQRKRATLPQHAVVVAAFLLRSPMQKELPSRFVCAGKKSRKRNPASNVDRTRDLQIFSLTLSQLSYRSG
jgi:hypothetical protein